MPRKLLFPNVKNFSDCSQNFSVIEQALSRTAPSSADYEIKWEFVSNALKLYGKLKTSNTWQELDSWTIT